MVGILAHGDNHFIVRDPLPDRDAARALIRHWSIIQIGATTPPLLEEWRISTKEFREDLEWAVIVAGNREISPAVAQLLDELSARGIIIHDSASTPGSQSAAASNCSRSVRRSEKLGQLIRHRNVWRLTRRRNSRIQAYCPEICVIGKDAPKEDT
jgi:hypothetical protein